MTGIRDIDLTDPELYRSGDPHAAWRLLRREAPVYFHPQRHGPGFWVLTRYEDVLRVSCDPATFSSAGGTSTMGAPPGTLEGRILVATDSPHHRRLRALVNRAFTPRMVGKLEPFVRAVVGNLAGRAAEAGTCDLVTDFAARIPFAVICELLGVPPGDRGSLFAAVAALLEGGSHLAFAGEARPLDLARYFLDLIEQRRRRPGEDLVSALAAVEAGGQGLEAADILALCVLLFVAGTETTMNAISGGALALLEHPGQRGRLQDDPSLLPAAVEEVLRWTSPVLVSIVRTATRDVELRGQRVRAGDKVTLWYPSANRDEDVFPDPDRFDVGRAPNEHLAFGFGEHFCLGASLARLEIRVALEELLRLPAPELAGQPRRLRSNIFAGLESLPVRFGRAGR